MCNNQQGKSEKPSLNPSTCKQRTQAFDLFYTTVLLHDNLFSKWWKAHK